MILSYLKTLEYDLEPIQLHEISIKKKNYNINWQFFASTVIGSKL